MNNKQLKIAILGGTGKEGTGLALRWAAAGYKIIIGSRQAEKAEMAAKAINAQLSIEAASGMENNDAARQADLCVMTVIQAAHMQMIADLKDALKGKILVDATARVDFRDPRPPGPPSAAQQSQEYLGPDVRVVAAFENVPASRLTKSLDQPVDADIFVCSDDMEAAEQVIMLARAAGMRGFYAGGLVNAIVVESLTSILISINKYYHVNNASIRISGVEP